MKQFNLLRFLLSGIAFAAIITVSGCNSGSPSGSNSNPLPKVCADFDNKQDECEKNSQNGKKCVYDVADNTCAPEGAREACGKLDPEACKDEPKCWLDAGNKCIPIGKKAGTCEAHQRDTACAADKKCEWENNKCLIKRAVTDIFTWKKINLPDTADKVRAVRVSGNQQHIYLYRDADDVAEKGIYHSNDNGENWTQLGSNGVLTGRPFLNSAIMRHATDVTMDCKVNQPNLVSTQNGVVAYLNGQIIVINEGAVEWALDTAVHNNVFFNPKKLLNGTDTVKDEPISFVRVVTTQAGESVLFGQQSANTVLMHKVGDVTSRTSKPVLFKTRKTDGSDLNQEWRMAGNTHDNQGILLASAEGVWEFPLANTDATNAADFGRTSDDNKVLFPEPAGAGINWVNNNVAYRFIGSFDNNGTPHYFAGLLHDAGSGAAGGFAHHNGPQAAGEHAELILDGFSVTSISQTDVTRLAVYNSGYKGINSDGTLNPANDYDMTKFAADKNHKLEDDSAVQAFTDDESKGVVLFGNPNKTFVWAHDVYMVTKSKGKPRP